MSALPFQTHVKGSHSVLGVSEQLSTCLGEMCLCIRQASATCNVRERQQTRPDVTAEQGREDKRR